MKKVAQITAILLVISILAVHRVKAQDGESELQRCFGNFRLAEISPSEFDHCFQSYLNLYGVKLNHTDMERQDFLDCLKRIWAEENMELNITD